MRTFLSLALLFCGIGLSAAAIVEEPTLRTRTDGHKLSVQFINLEQQPTSFTIATALEPRDHIFSERIVKHNGHRKNFDLSNLEKGRYVLAVNHGGNTYKQMVRVSKHGVWVSEWKIASNQR